LQMANLTNSSSPMESVSSEMQTLPLSEFAFEVDITILSILSIVVCGAAFLTTWIFEKQRRFPLSIIGWVSLIDFLFNLVDLLVRVLSPAQAYAQTDWHSYCRLAASLSVFFQVASSITNTLLAFTIFNLVYRRKDMSIKKTPVYRYSFVVIFWIWTVAFGIGVSMTTIHSPETNCGPASLSGALALLVPFCILVFLQVAFITVTVFHVQSVSSHIRGQITDEAHKARRKDFFVYARFIAIIIVQILQGFPQLIFWTVGVTHNPGFYFLVVSAYIGECTSILNSVVIMASNRSLRKWFMKKVLRRETSSSLSTHSRSIVLADPNGTSP